MASERRALVHVLRGLVVLDERRGEARLDQAGRDHVGAHAALGAEYREEGNFVDAKIHLERAVALNPKDLRAHYQLGLVYAKLGDQDAARKMFARADELRAEERKQDILVLKLIDPPE